MVQKIFDNWGGTFRYWGAIIVDDSEEGGHRIQEVIWWLALQELDYRTSYAPVCSLSTVYAWHLWATDQISDAVVAPDCSMTSGATAKSVSTWAPVRVATRTPVWTPHDRVVAYGTRGGATCNTKIRQLHTTILVREDICALDIAMDDTLVVQIHEPFQDLRDVYTDQCFGELPELLANVVERAILAESTRVSSSE